MTFYLKKISFLLLSLFSIDALNIPISVKTSHKEVFRDFPISVVVPFPKGNNYTTSKLGVKGKPSQIEVLERWPSDKSLRNVLVHFQASYNPLRDNQYFLVDRLSSAPKKKVTVSETSNLITVNTGKIRFTVKKVNFNLINELWVDRNRNGKYEASEKFISSNNMNGGNLVPRNGAGSTQYDSHRIDVDVMIEERGPMRVVIRAEALTKFSSTTDHQHGFAVRLIAYANKDYVKVDYQLQNSAKNVKLSWPLYFEAMDMTLNLKMLKPKIIFGSTDGKTYTTTSTGLMAQTRHDSYEILDGTGNVLSSRSSMRYQEDYRNGTGFMHLVERNVAVTAISRNFWQMWPNGLKFQNRKMTMELFPSWSAQWEQGDKQTGTLGRESPTGLYWIKDMQHVYKEYLFVFHQRLPKTTDVRNLASNFQFHPVGAVGTDWQRSARASFDFGGYIPRQITYSQTNSYEEYYFPSKLDADARDYSCNVRVWGDPEIGYRDKAYTPGGWPYSNEAFLVTGNSSDYFLGEMQAIGEIGVRPQWMAGYNFSIDQNLLKLTTNPYPPSSWRAFDGHGISFYASPLLPGTEVETDIIPRDDAHGWFYHVFQSYMYTGNPWVKDWYKFIAEFRKIRLSQGDPWPDMSDRAIAHSIHHAYQAARITNDQSFVTYFKFYLTNFLRPAQDVLYGQQLDSNPGAGGGFQTGYLMRAIIACLEYVQGVDIQAYAEAFQYLSGLMAWNLNYGNFAYYHNPSTSNGSKGVSSGTGLTLVDPQAWYYWNTGKEVYWDQVLTFVATGINGGERPYGTGFVNGEWNGQFEGRMYNYVLQTIRLDKIPPTPINDLKARRSGTQVEINWTTPPDANRFHIVWSPLVISELQTTNTNLCNWWAANTVGSSLIGRPGTVQSIKFQIPDARNIYVAIFSFDVSNNMSQMSQSVLTLSV